MIAAALCEFPSPQEFLRLLEGPTEEERRAASMTSVLRDGLEASQSVSDIEELLQVSGLCKCTPDNICLPCDKLCILADLLSTQQGKLIELGATPAIEIQIELGEVRRGN